MEEEKVGYEAIADWQRTKIEILDSKYTAHKFLTRYRLVLHSSSNSEVVKESELSKPQLLKSLREAFIAQVLHLYRLMRVYIPKVKESKDFDTLYKLDKFQVQTSAEVRNKLKTNTQLVEYWTQRLLLLDEFVHRLGITKITVNKEKKPELAFKRSLTGQ